MTANIGGHGTLIYGTQVDGTPTVVTVDASGNFILGSTGGTSMLDNSAFTQGGSSLTPVGYLGKDAPSVVTDGRVATPRLNRATRVAYAELLDSAGNSLLGQKVMASSLPVTLASDQSALVVTGTFWQATQPVSGTFWQATQPVSGTFWQATQPISGTVTANLGTIAGVATEATLAALKALVPTALGAHGGFVIEGVASGTTVPVSGTVSSNATLQTQTDTVMVGGVNVKEINAAAPLMGNGTTGTGSLRVTIASDNTAFSTNSTLQTQTDTVMVGGVNIKEINAVAPLMGAGNTGTGSLRVTVASDQAQIPVIGGAASGGTVSAPVQTGGRAATSPPTAVSNAQVVEAMFDIYGKQIVRESLREDLANQATSISSSTSETTIVTADATYKLDLYGLIVTNTSATVCKVTIKDSTAGTTRATLEIPATETRGFMVPPSGAHKQNAANNNWTATCGTSVATIEITAMTTRSL